MSFLDRWRDRRAPLTSRAFLHALPFLAVIVLAARLANAKLASAPGGAR